MHPSGSDVEDENGRETRWTCPNKKGPRTQRVNVPESPEHPTLLVQWAPPNPVCRTGSSHDSKKVPSNLRLLIHWGWAAGCCKACQFSLYSLSQTQRQVFSQGSHFTQVRVRFGLFPWDWLSFPGFGGVRTSQSFHIYLSIRPNGTNANKHVFQVHLCHSRRFLCIICWERGETTQSRRSHPGRPWGGGVTSRLPDKAAPDRGAPRAKLSAYL